VAGVAEGGARRRGRGEDEVEEQEKC